MELPQYHIPQAKTVLLHVWERLKGFIIKAGTILFLACVVMWFLGGFGFTDGWIRTCRRQRRQLAGSNRRSDRSTVCTTWIWRVAAGSSFSFRIYSKRSNRFYNGSSCKCSPEIVRRRSNSSAGELQHWFPSAMAAFTFLLFNLLDSPCLAAIATMAQQMQSRKWFWFAILFQNVFAYVVCLMRIPDRIIS